MTTKIITHADCLQHLNVPGHPEQVARLQYVLAALAQLGLEIVNAPLITDEAYYVFIHSVILMQSVLLRLNQA